MDFSILSTVLWILVIFLIISMILSLIMQRKNTGSRRLQTIKHLEEQRNSRVITLIHRQEKIALLGVPISRYIDIDDSEALLRAVRLTPDDLPIDLIIQRVGSLTAPALFMSSPPSC